MPDSDPPPKYTASTMVQAALAGQLLVQCLCVEDPRVQRAYVAWCVRHDLVPGIRVVSPAALQSVQRDHVHDVTMIEQLLRDTLQLPYPSLAPLLLFQWALTFSPTMPDARVALDPQDVGLPPGVAAKNEGEHLARDVGWFYRATVKVPPDKVYQLAKERQARKQDAGEHAAFNVSVVQDGIKRVRRLLDIFADTETSQPFR